MGNKHFLLPYASALLLAHCWVTFLCTLAVALTNSIADESALLALKAHIRFDPNSILATSWTNTTSYCNWTGVSCHRTLHLQRVIALNLSNMGLQGTIPPHVGNLSQLEELDLGWNLLSGSIPKEISNLLKLKILSLPSNNLTGSIPSAIFNISSLQSITLSNNSLSGTLPIDMCHGLPKLEAFRLSRNQLGAEIPTSMGRCRELKIISMLFNNLTGSVPEGIGNLSKLDVLYLGFNSLTEYGSEGIVSTSGDVYSFGIMLMETFTRKKPTDNMFSGELTLKNWVESLSGNLIDVADANLLRREDEDFSAKENCVSSIMTLALESTTESPMERLNMNGVVVRIEKIRMKFLGLN